MIFGTFELILVFIAYNRCGTTDMHDSDVSEDEIPILQTNQAIPLGNGENFHDGHVAEDKKAKNLETKENQQNIEKNQHKKAKNDMKLKSNMATEQAEEVFRIEKKLETYVSSIIRQFGNIRRDCRSECRLLYEIVKKQGISTEEGHSLQPSKVLNKVLEFIELSDEQKITKSIFKSSEEIINNLKERKSALIKDLLVLDPDSEFTQKCAKMVECFKTVADKALSSYKEICDKIIQISKQARAGDENILEQVFDVLKKERAAAEHEKCDDGSPSKDSESHLDDEADQTQGESANAGNHDSIEEDYDNPEKLQEVLDNSIKYADRVIRETNDFINFIYYELIFCTERTQQLRSENVKLPKRERVLYEKASIKIGESLYEELNKYNDLKSAIKEVEKIKSSIIEKQSDMSIDAIALYNEGKLCNEEAEKVSLAIDTSRKFIYSAIKNLNELFDILQEKIYDRKITQRNLKSEKEYDEIVAKNQAFRDEREKQNKPIPVKKKPFWKVATILVGVIVIVGLIIGVIGVTVKICK
ncbi:hypothetical protein ENBRE01_0341 [Enteropsectra breve]|nr:hypothetical protein ENBRE01_0341 [Enteropsectra breve]